MIRKYEVHYGYSAAQLLEVEARETYRDVKGCLAMAPNELNRNNISNRGDLSQFRGPNNVELPGTFREVKALVDLGYEGDYLFGKEATEGQFKKLAENYSVLHLAQHGKANAEDPVMSYLKFATPSDSSEDGKLYTYELEALRLKAELAVLSACETGIGKFLPGEGTASLGRQFIASGVATVVMTLWQVGDEVSADLIKRFFTYLEAGENSATALHKAKTDFLLTSDSRTAHPYYWSSYILNGVSREVPIGKGMSTNWVFVLLGGSVLVGLGWWRRKRSQAA